MPGSQQQSANPSVIYRLKMGHCQDPPLKPSIYRPWIAVYSKHTFLPNISFSKMLESRPRKVPSQHFDNEGHFFCWLLLKGSLGTTSVTGSSASRHAFLFPFSFGFRFFYLQCCIVQSTWLIQYSLRSSQAAEQISLWMYFKLIWAELLWSSINSFLTMRSNYPFNKDRLH